MACVTKVSKANFIDINTVAEMPWMLANIYSLMTGKHAMDDGKLDKPSIGIRFFK